MNMRTTLLAGLVTAGLPLAAAADVELNAALSSDYVFRGFTQTDNDPALSGGIDWSHASGFYAGSWASGVSKGAEVDFYVGFGGEAGAFGYDIGAITYEYTDEDFFNGAFREIYVGGSYGPASLKYYDGYDTAANADYGYIEFGAELPLGETESVTLHYGVFDPDGGESVNDIGLTLATSRFAGFDLSATITNEDAGDETEVFLTIGKSWSASAE